MQLYWSELGAAPLGDGTEPPGNLRPPGTRTATVATKPSRFSQALEKLQQPLYLVTWPFMRGTTKQKLPVSYWGTLATGAAMTQVYQLSWEMASSHMEQKLACSFGK